MPTENDLLLQASDSIETGDGSAAIDTRLRIGSPRRVLLGTTQTDAQIAHDVALGLPPANLPAYVDGLTAEPDASDPLGPVKRAQMFTPRIGVNLTSGGHFNAYLRQSFDARVIDGQILWQAVDHDFKPGVPGLSYLRLGKPEKKADGTAGDPEADLATEPLAGQKFTSGIGIFSDGTLNAWTKQEIKLVSDEKIKLVSRDLHTEYDGENYTVSYELKNLSDEKNVKSGEKKATSFSRKIVSVDFRRKLGAAWYQQTLKYNWSLAFNAALKGDVAFSASYALSVGAKIDQSYALSYACSLSGKAGFAVSYEQQVGPSGSVYKGNAGYYSAVKNHDIKASDTITFQIAQAFMLKSSIEGADFKSLTKASMAAQLLAMSLYNAVVLGMAGDNKEAELRKALDHGAILYAAATSLSLITAAFGALQAYSENVRLKAARSVPAIPPPAALPTITLKSTEIELKIGASSIKMTPLGVWIEGTQIFANGSVINHNAPAINHNPVPQPAPPEVDVDAAAAAADVDVDVDAAAPIPDAPPM